MENMKKQLLLAIVFVAAALMSSCRKEDLDMLRHPIYVQGEIAPNLQLPLASSSRMNFGDLLSMFDGTFSNVLVPGTDLIIFTYDTSFSDHAPLSEMTGAKGGRKIITHKWVEKTVDIDLFEKSDMSLLEEADISIQELMLDLYATLQAVSHDTTAERLLRQYGSAQLDSLQISYTKQNNEVGVLGTQDVPPLIIDTLTNLNTWHATLNLADIFNKRPKSITYRFKIDVNIDNSFMTDPYMVTTAITNPERVQEVQDSVQNAMMYYGAQVAVTFPFEVHIGHLKYSYPIAINRGTSGDSENDDALRKTFDKIQDILNGRLSNILDADLDSLVILKMVVRNGIPLNINLNGILINAAGDSTGVLFPYQGIPSCSVVNNEADSLHPGLTNPPISIPLNMETLEKFMDTDSIRISMMVSTYGNTPVRIKKSDGLDMKLYIQLHPKLNFNWDVMGSENNDNE